MKIKQKEIKKMIENQNITNDVTVTEKDDGGNVTYELSPQDFAALTATATVLQLKVNETIQADTCVNCAERAEHWFKLTVLQTGDYSFSANTYGLISCQLYDVTRTELVSDNIGEEDTDFFINYTLLQGQVYYLRIIPNRSGFSRFNTVIIGTVTPVESVSISADTVSLIPNETVILSATVLPENATDKTIEWNSSNSGVAKVDKNSGKVTAVSPGTAIISARMLDGSEKEDTCLVTVQDPVLNGTPGRVNCSSGLSLMSNPVDGTVLGTFANGANITLLDETPQNEIWYHVYGVMSNGSPAYGWCSGEYLEKEVKYITSKYQGTINVRVEPDKDVPPLGYLSKGDRVLRIMENVKFADGYNWNKILYAGIIAYAVNDSGDFDESPQWDLLVVKKSYKDFLHVLAGKESSHNYEAVSGSHLGMYQMGNGALEDATFKKNGEWTKLAKYYGVTSNATFLSCPQAQEVAIRLYHKSVWKALVDFGAEKVIGSLYQNVTITESGLLAAAHLVGASAIMKAIMEDKPIPDENGTQAYSYMNLMNGYDISTIK